MSKPLSPICQHEEPYADRANKMKAKPCQHKATKQGWCNDHAFVVELLELAKKLGYPSFVVVYGTSEPIYTIGSGCANWEAYAVRAEYRHFGDMKRRLTEVLSNTSQPHSERRSVPYLRLVV